MGNNWMELGLTEDEEKFVRIGAALYKTVYLDTIDNVFVIARALKILHDRHHGSGIKGGFTDALVQYGFTARDGGPMNKAIVSHLGQLLAHEAEVRAWWGTVPERVKRDWLSAKAIHRHWTNSKKPAEAPRQPAPYAAAMTATNIKQAEPEARPQDTETEADTSSDLDDAIDVILDHLETLEPIMQIEFVDDILSPLWLASRPLTRRNKLTWKANPIEGYDDDAYIAYITEQNYYSYYFLLTQSSTTKFYGVSVCLPGGYNILVAEEASALSLAEAKKVAEAHHAAGVDHPLMFPRRTPRTDPIA